MTYDFRYEALPMRVRFGAGSLASLPEELDQIGLRRVLVLCSPGQQDTGELVTLALGERSVGLRADAVMHVPAHVAERAQAEAVSLGADGCVTVGGGSAIGLGKAIALESDLPILAIPTTYAGSEMTPIFGLTEGGLKRTGTDLRVLPKTVIYDPELTLTLPAQLALTSGINAIAHAAEGLYSRDANPIISLMAEEGIASLARALPVVVAHPEDSHARSQALYGAWLCGTVLGSVGMALHHKLCHTLGGSFNLPHASTHTIILPHALAYNASAAPDAMKRIARALGHDNAAMGVYELAKANGAQVALKDIGMSEAQLDRAAEIASANPYWNPRAVEYNAIRALLQDAFDGVPPREH